MLVQLDLSAVFDTVDHNILLERLDNWVGLSGWYLNGSGRAGRYEQKFISLFLADLRYTVYISVFCIWIKQIK